MGSLQEGLVVSYWDCMLGIASGVVLACPVEVQHWRLLDGMYAQAQLLTTGPLSNWSRNQRSVASWTAQVRIGQSHLW